MERDPSLRRLSSEHHHALVLARRAHRAATGESDETPGEAWQHVEREWRERLAPHFLVEESALFDALERAGEGALVQRAREDHAAMRRCLETAREEPVASLRQFASLLEHHVRFEERELFQVAQARLTAAELEAIAPD